MFIAVLFYIYLTFTFYIRIFVNILLDLPDIYVLHLYFAFTPIFALLHIYILYLYFTFFYIYLKVVLKYFDTNFYRCILIIYEGIQICKV